MPIEDFTESEIRIKILNKIDPVINNKRSPHWMGKIFLGKKLIAKVKIPNDHQIVKKHSYSRRVATDLKLTDAQFTDLIKCPLKGPAYYKILKNFQ